VASDTIIHLKCPAESVNRTRFAEADVVINMHDVVIKDRIAKTPRPATPAELDRATEVYG
jgi:hypothetical protein